MGKLGNDASLSREFRVYSRDGGYAYGISSEVKRNEGLNEGLTRIGIDKKQTMVEGSESRKYKSLRLYRRPPGSHRDMTDEAFLE